jgi:hypothetical protein
MKIISLHGRPPATLRGVCPMCRTEIECEVGEAGIMIGDQLNKDGTMSKFPCHRCPACGFCDVRLNEYRPESAKGDRP